MSLIMLSLTGLSTASLAASFVVDTTADSIDISPGDGICLDSTGSCSLRAAIHESNSLAGADSISLPAGTYTLSVVVDGVMDSWFDTLLIEDELSITGAGSDADPSTSTIVGNTLASVFSIYNASTVWIDGLTVSEGGGYVGSGAGIWSNGTTVVLDDVTVRDNRADDLGSFYWVDGGGIYNGSGGTMSISNSEILQNVAAQGNYWSGGYAEGGGIYNAGVMSLTDTQIEGNSSAGYSSLAGYGGGIFNSGSLSCTRCTISENTSNFGGGISSSGDLILSESSIIANDALLDSDYSMFYGVGGGLETTGTVTVDRTAVVFNTAEGWGGGWYLTGGSTYAENLTVSNNTARLGGGLQVAGGSLELVNATVAQNQATKTPDTGGLSNVGGTVTVTNTILAGRASTLAAACSGVISSGGYNIVRIENGLSGSACSGFTSGTDSVGSTASPVSINLFPLMFSSLTWVHPLGPSSPAVETGSNADCPAVDQRGLYRPFDSNADGNAICDIGAYERGFALKAK